MSERGNKDGIIHTEPTGDVACTFLFSTRLFQRLQHQNFNITQRNETYVTLRRGKGAKWQEKVQTRRRTWTHELESADLAANKGEPVCYHEENGIRNHKGGEQGGRRWINSSPPLQHEREQGRARGGGGGAKCFRILVIFVAVPRRCVTVRCFICQPGGRRHADFFPHVAGVESSHLH